MSFNAPQTLSVKRKRDDAPVDNLLIEQSSRSAKKAATESNRYIFRRVPNINIPSGPVQPSPQPPTPRRFHLFGKAKELVLVERKEDIKQAADAGFVTEAQVESESAPAPRKRPGAGSALKRAEPRPNDVSAPTAPDPTDEHVRKFERFAQEVSVKEEAARTAPARTSPTADRHKPKVPALRYKDRQQAKKETGDVDMMDADSSEYVYDTYVREVVMDDANGLAPVPVGSVGVIVITDEDEELWDSFEQDAESDKEFDTDDEDENAEDYYGADYPEDEVDSDDEYGVNPYRYNHGDEEEFDADGDAWSDEEGANEDLPWKRNNTHLD